jgi:hypothetical protein
MEPTMLAVLERSTSPRETRGARRKPTPIGVAAELLGLGLVLLSALCALA